MLAICYRRVFMSFLFPPHWNSDITTLWLDSCCWSWTNMMMMQEQYQHGDNQCLGAILCLSRFLSLLLHFIQLLLCFVCFCSSFLFIGLKLHQDMSELQPFTDWLSAHERFFCLFSFLNSSWLSTAMVLLLLPRTKTISLILWATACWASGSRAVCLPIWILVISCGIFGQDTEPQASPNASIPRFL